MLFEGERSGLYRCSGCVKAAGGNLQEQQEGHTILRAVDTILQGVAGYPLMIGGGRRQMDGSVAAGSGAPLTSTKVNPKFL